MTPPVWTILIATHASRRFKLARLLDGLLPQVEDVNADPGGASAVTVEALWNNGERPLGRVRQDLLEHATATYVCFCDDDDEVAPYYVDRALPLLDGEVDYIGWQIQCFFNGNKMKPAFHSLRYGSWSDDADGYYRDISHLNPVRRDLTTGTTFCAGWPEDVSWVEQMRGRLKTERYIEDEMYLYRRVTSAAGDHPA